MRMWQNGKSQSSKQATYELQRPKKQPQCQNGSTAGPLYVL